MGCTCSKVQNEEGISRCRSRKKVVKKALKWRNQYAAAHSEYIIALANLGVAVRQFTDGEFRDHISSSSATSSSTSTPMPRTPTTPPTASVVEEIISRVKLPPMAVKSNPPSSISVIVSPPRTPKGSARNKHYQHDEEEYQQYMEADAPPEGLYTYIKQPNQRTPSEPSSSYTYSSYSSADPYATTPSQYSSMPPEPPSWDIFGIFHFPPTMEFYNGGLAEEEEHERERNFKRVIEEEDMPALEVGSPDRDHRHRREKSRESHEDREEEIQDARHHEDRQREERSQEERRPEERSQEERRREERSQEERRREESLQEERRRDERLQEERLQEERQREDRLHSERQREERLREERLREEERQHEERLREERQRQEKQYTHHEEKRHHQEPERRHEEEHQNQKHKREEEYEIQEEDHGRREKNKSVVLEEIEEEELRLPKDVPSTSRAVFNEILEENVRMPEPPKAAHHDEKRPPPLVPKDMEAWEVLRLIEEQFQKASRTGDDVSRMLEARRAHYNSSYSESGFTRRSARIFKAVSRSSQWSSPRTPLSWNASEDSSSEDFVSTREEGHGGTTLDRLYAWEKKLYAEVKENDIINVDYERKCKRLKKLDARGASNELIDKTTVSIKVLETQMQVSMHAMKATSKAIHDLTDKYMHPQLLDLLSGYLVMWKSMALCHEKQKLASARLKKGGQTPLEATSNSHRQATMQLEHALNQWHRSLNSLTNKHREYMRNLTSWLRLSTFTPDRDKDKGPPPVLNLCQTWLSTLEGLPNGEAVQAIKNFAEAIHNIVRLQAEEGRIQKRAEVSARELSKKAQALHNLEKKLVLSSSTAAAATSEKSSSSSPKRDGSPGFPDPVHDTLIEKKVALELFRKRVEEEKDNFSRAMQETRRTTLECLENGLPPLLSSFSDYAECCSRAYQELQQRVRNVE